MRRQFAPLVIFACLGIAGQVRAQGAAAQDQEFLLALYPTLSDALQAPEQLIDASAQIAAAADLMACKNRTACEKSCSMDRELIGFGAALANASDALKWMEPLLLKPLPVDLGELVHPTPETSRTLQANFQRRQAYRAALDKLGQAAKMLSALDPIGSAGPPEKSGIEIRDAGQALVDLDEQSGIAVHIALGGRAVEAFRQATIRLDRAGCVEAARLVASSAGLIGHSLAFSRAIIWQSESARAISAALLDMSQPAARPPLDELAHAFGLYASGLRQQAQALLRQAEIAQRLVAPAEFADDVARYRGAAPLLAERAGRFEPIVAHIDQARSALAATPSGSGGGAAAAMRSAGSTLSRYGVWHALIAAGDGLVRAGDQLDAGRSDAAAQTMLAAAKDIAVSEKPLVLEKP